jgi:hypothetical protein
LDGPVQVLLLWARSCTFMRDSPSQVAHIFRKFDAHLCIYACVHQYHHSINEMCPSPRRSKFLAGFNFQVLTLVENGERERERERVNIHDHDRFRLHPRLVDRTARAIICYVAICTGDVNWTPVLFLYLRNFSCVKKD